MIDPDFWKEQIKDIVLRISDKEYQYQQWFVEMTDSSNADELFCQLYNDYSFDLFLQDKILNLTKRQLETGCKLQYLMDEYCKVTETRLSEEKVYNDPRWEEIRQAAKDFYDSLCE